MESTGEFRVKERMIGVKNKLDTLVDEIMGGRKLEIACLIFATFDIMLKIAFMCIALFGADAAVEWLTASSPAVDPRFSVFLRCAVLIDSIIGLVYSVCLFVAVKKHNVRLMRVCFIYGVVVLSLAVLALIPNLVRTLAGDVTGFAQVILSLVSKVLVTIEVLVVYKTYMKFKNDNELRHLVTITNTDDKQNTQSGDYDCDKVFYKTVV